MSNFTLTLTKARAPTARTASPTTSATSTRVQTRPSTSWSRTWPDPVVSWRGGRRFGAGACPWSATSWRGGRVASTSMCGSRTTSSASVSTRSMGWSRAVSTSSACMPRTRWARVCPRIPRALSRRGIMWSPWRLRLARCQIWDIRLELKVGCWMKKLINRVLKCCSFWCGCRLFMI